MPKVEVFFSQMCGLCHEAMDYFRTRDVPFEAYEVHWRDGKLADSAAARDLQARIGDVDYVPQIFIDGRHISGWRTLSRLIETGEIDKYLDGSATLPGPS